MKSETHKIFRIACFKFDRLTILYYEYIDVSKLIEQKKTYDHAVPPPQWWRRNKKLSKSIVKNNAFDLKK